MYCISFQDLPVVLRFGIFVKHTEATSTKAPVPLRLPDREAAPRPQHAVRLAGRGTCGGVYRAAMEGDPSEAARTTSSDAIDGGTGYKYQQEIAQMVCLRLI